MVFPSISEKEELFELKMTSEKVIFIVDLQKNCFKEIMKKIVFQIVQQQFVNA